MRIHTSLLVVPLLLLLPVGCGDEDPDGGSGGANAGGASSGGNSGSGASSSGPCGPDEIRVWGTIDGQSIDVVGTTDGHITMMETTSVPGDTVSVTLESAGGWTYGGTEACHGSVSKLALGNVGNCPSDPFQGERTVDDDGDGAVFTLTGLLMENPASEEYDLQRFCGGTPVSGELSGCFRF